MKTFTTAMRALLDDASGQDLIEYALIAGLIGLVAVATLQTLATAITGIFTKIQTQLNSITG